MKLPELEQWGLRTGSGADKGMIGAVRSKNEGQTSESTALITASIDETNACNRGHCICSFAAQSV